jgi:predicted PurR-regulated permease PerM
MQKVKINRSWATIIILGSFFTLLFFVFKLVLPLLYEQFFALVKALPSYIDTINDKVYPKIQNWFQELGLENQMNFKETLSSREYYGIATYFENLFENIMQSSLNVINFISLAFVTPVLIFYFIRDWKKITKTITKLIPKKHKTYVRKLFREIDSKISGYIRGQFNVCLILGAFYGIGLNIVGLNFGFLIGFLTGLFSFIPYVGMLFGTVAALIIAFFHVSFGIQDTIIMLIVFFVGQVIESNFLTPKLVGEKIGIHPVWVIFSLFAFGSLFGFVGLLIAVPTSAIISVIFQHIINR